MKQAELGLNLSTKRTRKREFLAQMERVVPWAALVELVAPYAPEGKKGRPPFAVATMLRIHFMQQWFTLSDPAMEEALHDMPLFREFAHLDYSTRLPDGGTILRFRHLLEQHKLADQMLTTINELLSSKGLLLKAGTVVDATLVAAPSNGTATGSSLPSAALRAPACRTGSQAINVIPADFAAAASKVIVAVQPASCAMRSIRQSAKSALPDLYLRCACSTWSARSKMISLLRSSSSNAAATC